MLSHGRFIGAALSAILSFAAVVMQFPCLASGQPFSLDAQSQELAARRRAIFAEDELFTPQGDIADPNDVLMPPPRLVNPRTINRWNLSGPPALPAPSNVFRRRAYYGIPYTLRSEGIGIGLYRPRFDSYDGYYPQFGPSAIHSTNHSPSARADETGQLHFYAR